MAFNHIAAAATGLVLLTGCEAATADSLQATGAQANGYKPGEYLTLDVPQAVMSPKLLGPSAQFEAYPITARADAKNEIDAAADRPAAQRAVPVAKPQRSVATRAQPPARSRVARSRSNPLDANAADTRIQTWPCRSGGICSWQR